MKKIQILNLNPSFDHTGIVKHKTNFNVVRVDEVVALSSGKGINVARVLHILGYQNYIVSNIIGGRIGKLIADGLKEEGMNVWNYLINNESRINYAYVDEFRGKVFMINEQGPVIAKMKKKIT
jgi:fructose-1-phosphate kinase PfkB-like protein